MISERKITLAGKEVNISYCYATEIGFKILAKEDIADFVQEIIECIKQQRDPDTEKSIDIILAAVQAYSESHGEKEAPIKDSDLMFHCTPQEMATALGTIIIMRSEFYNLPKGEEQEPTEEEREAAEKNV